MDKIRHKHIMDDRESLGWLTSLTPVGFREILKDFRRLSTSARKAESLTRRGQRPRTRAAGAGRVYTLGIPDRLLMALIWCRRQPSYRHLGERFGLSPNRTRINVQQILELLKDNPDLPEHVALNVKAPLLPPKSRPPLSPSPIPDDPGYLALCLNPAERAAKTSVYRFVTLTEPEGVRRLVAELEGDNQRAVSRGTAVLKGFCDVGLLSALYTVDKVQDSHKGRYRHLADDLREACEHSFKKAKSRILLALRRMKRSEAEDWLAQLASGILRSDHNLLSPILEEYRSRLKLMPQHDRDPEGAIRRLAIVLRDDLTADLGNG